MKTLVAESILSGIEPGRHLESSGARDSTKSERGRVETTFFDGFTVVVKEPKPDYPKFIIVRSRAPINHHVPDFSFPASSLRT